MREDRRAAPMGPALLIGNGLALLLALLGCVFSIRSAYGAEEDGGRVLLFCVLFGLASLLLWSLPKRPWAWALGISGALALVVWRHWEGLSQAALRLVSQAVDTLAGRLWWVSELSFQWEYQYEEYLLPCRLLAVAALALCLGWMVVRLRSWWLVLGIGIVPVLPAIAAGILPAWPALLALTASSLGLLLTSLYSRRDPVALGRSLLIALGAVSVLLVTMTAALPQTDYVYPQWAQESGDWLVETGSRWLEEAGFGGDSGGTSAPTPAPVEGPVMDGSGEPVDLAGAGPRHFTGRVVLRVEGEEPGRVYLRGASAAGYTGESWELLDPVVWQQFLEQLQTLELYRSGEIPQQYGLHPLQYPAQTAPDAREMTMEVRHAEQTEGVYYVPYQMDAAALMPLRAMGDAYLPRSMEVERYELTYRAQAVPEENFVPLEGPAARAEALYRAFVREQYLSVPEQAAAALAPLLAGMENLEVQLPEELPEEYTDEVRAARQAAKVLSQTAVYDLAAPAMAPGSDFVESFLTQGRGYCMHYATAGTLLLRLSGIPARYVSGYLGYLAWNGEDSVRDSAAHAWVEIYLDGYGWYPVEVTPAFLGEGGEVPVEEPLPEPETPEVEEPEAEDEPEEEPEEETEAPAAPLSPERKWLRRALLVLLAVAALLTPRMLALGLRRWQRTRRETNRSAAAAYRYYRRLLSWGAEEEPLLEELGRKAAFSQYQLTEEERSDAWTCAQRAARKVEFRLHWWRKLLLRWVYLLN